MKVETIKHDVAELPIPANKSQNPLMIETPGMPIGTTHGPTMITKATKEPVTCPEAVKAPVAFPVGGGSM